MTPFNSNKKIKYGPSTPRDICYHQMSREGSYIILWSLLTHLEEKKKSLGVLGPLGTYVVIESIERCNRLSYGPFWPIQIDQVGL
jgi:hypothetical protein